MFKINVSCCKNNKMQGQCHGASVFTDDLHYILKGNKILKCSLEQMNDCRHNALYRPSEAFRAQYLQREQFLIKASNLPKSFGFLLQAPHLYVYITYKMLGIRSTH